MKVACTLAAATGLMLAGLLPALAQTSCTNETIAGTYAAHGQGWVGLAEPFSPETVVGTRKFDGSGKFTGSGHQTIAGVPRSFSITGTYSVAADCTLTIEGTATSPSATASALDHWFGVVADAGNKIFVMRIDKGTTTNTEFDRIVPIY
jgi:hypothetical protein